MKFFLFGQLHRERMRVFLACLVLGTYVGSVSRGQELGEHSESAIAGSSTSEPWPEEIITEVSLPLAPPDLQTLMDKGQVTFVFYDDVKFPRKFQGETRFDMQYASKSDFRWRQVRVRGGDRVLIVRPQIRRLELSATHKILLPRRLVSDRFYDHPLVRHELDHVRISTDARFSKQFESWAQNELKEIRHRLESSETDFNAISEEAIRERLSTRFREVMELVRIRYAELDQQTRHGADPLPQDFFATPEVQP